MKIYFCIFLNFKYFEFYSIFLYFSSSIQIGSETVLSGEYIVFFLYFSRVLRFFTSLVHYVMNHNAFIKSLHKCISRSTKLQTSYIVQSKDILDL